MADQPEAKPTLQIPKAEIAEGLLRSVERAVTVGFADVKQRLDSQDTQLEMVMKEGQRTNSRLTLIEGRVEDVESRMSRASTGVRGLSQTDATHDAQLAQERSAREALAIEVAAVKADVTAVKTEMSTQTAILTRLDKVASNPTVKVILFALGTIATGYLASRGLVAK